MVIEEVLGLFKDKFVEYDVVYFGGEIYQMFEIDFIRFLKRNLLFVGYDSAVGWIEKRKRLNR